MPSPKSCHRKGGTEKNKKGRLSERALSFHGRGGGVVAAEMLPRPRTVPDLLAAGRSSGGSAAEENMGRPQKLTKLLLHVTVQRSPGAVHVLLPPEATVDDLIAAAIRQYVKEARRPVIPADGASGFDLHYSQFSLESLDREEKLMELGSRNFFLCPKEAAAAAATTNTSGGACVMTSAKCSKEVVDEAMKKDLPWLKLMNFLL